MMHTGPIGPERLARVSGHWSDVSVREGVFADGLACFYFNDEDGCECIAGPSWYDLNIDEIRE